MKKILTESEIANMLLEDKFSSWSEWGARALANYLKDLDMELDIVSIRGSYGEYNSALEAAKYLASPGEYGDTEHQALDYLNRKTHVICFDGGVVLGNF